MWLDTSYLNRKQKRSRKDSHHTSSARWLFRRWHRFWDVYCMAFFPIIITILGNSTFSQDKEASACFAEIIILCLLIASLKHCTSWTFTRTDGCALLLWGWCTIVDVMQPQWSISSFMWSTSLLLFIIYLGNKNIHLDRHIRGVSAITVAIALHQILLTLSITHHPLFSNPCGYATAIGIGLPFLSHVVISSCRSTANYSNAFKRNLRYLGAFLITALIVTALFATQSRSALFALFVVLLIDLLRSLQIKIVTRTRHIVAVLCCLIILLCTLGGLYALRPSSANGRLFIYEVLCNGIGHSPWIGYGSHGIYHDYMPQQADYFLFHQNDAAALLAANVSYPFNELLGFIYKFGLIGMVILCSILFYLFHYMHPMTGRRRRLFLMMRSPLLILIFIGMFSYPTSYPYVVLSALIIICLWAQSGKIDTCFVVTPHPILRLSVISILIVSLLFPIQRLIAEIRWKQGEDLILNGCTENGLRIYSSIASRLYDHPGFLYNYAAELNLSGRFMESQELLAQCTLVLNNYDTELLNGDNALHLQQFQQAKKHFYIASHMIPSRFMPLYGMMQANEMLEDTIALQQIAIEIIQKPIKVPSEDVSIIVNNAKAYLNSTSY